MRDLQLEMWIARNILGLSVYYTEGEESFGYPDYNPINGEVELVEFPPISEDNWTESMGYTGPIFKKAEELGLSPAGSTPKQKLTSIKDQLLAKASTEDQGVVDG